ncbi:MAG: hypothetical protein GXP54_06180 [Deltaproteobacteria bacterium]|nr:hypothetical protein [Deltaproteobacteria bacterium]
MGWRKTLLAFTLIAAAAIPRPARAQAGFGEVRQVLDGTAYTLEEGDLTVGILGPIRYGLLDQLMIVTHPVLHLLLTPNALLKWKAYDGDAALAFNLGYIQTFLDSKSFPGTVSFFPTVSFPINWRVVISAEAGYLLDLSPITHGVMFGSSFSVLITDSDLLSLHVQDEYYWDGGGLTTPTIILAYSHAFYRMRLKVGLAVGRFPIQVGTTTRTNGDIVPDNRELPVYPVIDLWWQL